MRVWISFFLLSVSAFAAAITSAKTGIWDDPTVWVGGVVPVSGDTAILAVGHTVTITGHTTVGNGAGTPAIKCSANGNTTSILAMADGSTLTFRGDIEQCLAPWTVGKDAIIEHDSSLAPVPSTTHYKWTIGMTTWPDAARLVIRGTSGHRTIIRNATGSGKFYGFTYSPSGDQGSGQFDFEYVTIDGCGGATPCAQTNSHNSSSASIARCDHCLVTNSSYMWASTVGNAPSGALNVVSFTNSTFTASTDATKRTIRLTLGGAGLVTLDTIYTDGRVAIGGSNDATYPNVRLRNVVVRLNISSTNGIDMGGARFAVGEFDRVMRITDVLNAGNASYMSLPGGNLTRLMGLTNATGNNYFFTGPFGVTGANDSVDGAWVETLNSTGGGDAFGSTGTVGSFTLKNTIAPCQASGWQGAMSLENMQTTSLHIWSLQNNTYCGLDDGAGSAQGFGFEQTGTAAVGMVSSVKNNIVFCNSSCTGWLVKQATVGVPQAGTYQGVDYNWKWNLTGVHGPYLKAPVWSSATAFSVGNRTEYSDGHSYVAIQAGTNHIPPSSPTYWTLTDDEYANPSVPGTHDASGDPQFVEQRHFLDWGQMLKPSITSWTDIVAEFAKMNDDSGYDSRFTILNAYTWLRDGYRPRNAAVMTAGDTGGRVGAMDAPASAITNVTVVGVTNTQATMSYNAPSVGTCSLELSESASYLPLVNDVNPGLFTNADNDSLRTTSIVSGTARTVVFGLRAVQTALDSKNYSRSLQANTPHYGRITCGVNSAEFTFTTANIPFNATYADLTSKTAVTLTSDRTQVFTDHQTGALIKRVSLPHDTGFDTDPVSGKAGPYMYTGGFIRVCSNNLMGSPPIGYLCSFAQGGGGLASLYYIIPSTGDSRYLGQGPDSGAYLYINSVDGAFYRSSLAGTGQVYKYVYTGDYSQMATPNTVASFSRTTLVSQINTLMQAFNPAFDPSLYFCFSATASGNHLMFMCKRSQNQDVDAWVSVLDLTTLQIVAAMRVSDNIQSRWSGIHELIKVEGSPLIQVQVHDENNGHLGGGPNHTTLTTTVNASDTTFLVSGEPVWNGGADAALPIAREGDIFQIGNERVRIITKNSPTSWVVSRAYTGTAVSHSSSSALTTVSTVQAKGSNSVVWWRFLDDPNGTDTTNTYYMNDPYWVSGGHDDTATGVMIKAQWSFRSGDPITGLGTPLTRDMTPSPLFAGADGVAYGLMTASHPSASLQGFFTDNNIYASGALASANPAYIAITGQLYRYLPNTAWPLRRKYLPTVGIDRGGLMTDVSGPSSVLGDTSADSGKYCIVYVAGECHTREDSSASHVGDVFVNTALTPTFAYCNGGYWGACVGNWSGVASQIMQMGTGGTTMNRSISSLAGGADYPSAKSLPDGSYLLFSRGTVTLDYAPSNLLMAKLPPLTAGDSVDRTKFIPYPVLLTAPVGLGVASAAIKFGYLEQGAVGDYHCTSRNEPCIANTNATPPADAVTDPFKYQTTDTWTGISCATTCTITLPLVPAHIAYYQPIYLDAGGAVVSTGPAGVAGDWIGVSLPVTGLTKYTGTMRMTGTAVLK